MEPTQWSETSDFNTQMPGKYPEDNSSNKYGITASLTGPNKYIIPEFSPLKFLLTEYLLHHNQQIAWRAKYRTCDGDEFFGLQNTYDKGTKHEHILEIVIKLS
jgi:hypothetical protein